MVRSVGAVWVDNDEAISGGQGGILAASICRLSCSMAPVRIHQDRWFGSQLIGDVNVKAHICRVLSEVFGYLNKRCCIAEGERCTDQERCTGNPVAGELHGAMCFGRGPRQRRMR